MPASSPRSACTRSARRAPSGRVRLQCVWRGACVLTLLGVAVRTDKPTLVTHGSTLRLYHVWLPLPPLVDWVLSLS